MTGLVAGLSLSQGAVGVSLSFPWLWLLLLDTPCLTEASLLWDQFWQRWNLPCGNLSWSSLGREWMQTAVTILPSLPIPMVMFWESTNLQSLILKSQSLLKEEATRSTSLGFIQRLECEEFKKINNTCTASCRSLIWGSTIDLSTSRTEEVNMFTIG